MKFKRINVLLYLCIGLMAVTLGLTSADPVQAQGANADVRQKSPGMGGMMPGGVPGMMPGAMDDAAEPSAGKPTIVRYTFRYTNAMDVIEILSELDRGLDQIMIAVDRRTQALIVIADDKSHGEIQEMIKVLDMPEEKQESQATLATYTFSDVEVMQFVTRSLLEPSDKVISGSAKPAKCTVMAMPETHARIKKFLEQYNKQLPGNNQVAVPRRVRMIWLLASREPDEFDEYGPAPEDMKPVIKELEKMGLKNIGLVAQAMVHTAGSNEFHLQSSPLFQGDPCDLQFEGRFDKQISDQLQISISGSQKTSSKEYRDVVGLESTIKARPGHPVVLAVSPTEDTTSIFVLITYDD